MSRRIETLSESPCYKCGCGRECLQKIKRSPRLMEICDAVIGNAEFDYKECPIWISLNAPEMEDEDGQ